MNGWCVSSVVDVWSGEDSGRMTGSDVKVLSSPSRCSWAISGWYGMTLMTERISSLLPPVNFEEQPREECIASRTMEFGGVGFFDSPPSLVGSTQFMTWVRRLNEAWTCKLFADPAIAANTHLTLGTCPCKKTGSAVPKIQPSSPTQDGWSVASGPVRVLRCPASPKQSMR